MGGGVLAGVGVVRVAVGAVGACGSAWGADVCVERGDGALGTCVGAVFDGASASVAFMITLEFRGVEHTVKDGALNVLLTRPQAEAAKRALETALSAKPGSSGIVRFTDSDRDWSKVGLGTKPDSQLARELGVVKQTVASARKRLGIPSYLEQLVEATRKCPAKRPKGIDWDAQPLGQVSDRELGRRLGVSSGAVRAARAHRGIEAWHS